MNNRTYHYAQNNEAEHGLCGTRNSLVPDHFVCLSWTYFRHKREEQQCTACVLLVCTDEKAEES